MPLRLPVGPARSESWSTEPGWRAADSCRHGEDARPLAAVPAAVSFAAVWKDLVGLILVVVALLGLGLGVREVTLRDYVAAALLLLAGVSTLWAGVDLLRPTIGE